MSDSSSNRTVERLLRQQAALAEFGSFAFREVVLHKILTEAARICAASLEVPYSKICRYRTDENDLLVEAGWGWTLGVVGRVISQADWSSPQGRAYITCKPVIIRNINTANDLTLPDFYREHGIVSTVDVVIPATEGVPYGVLEIDSTHQRQYDVHDINFLTGFANVLAEAVATVERVNAMRALLAANNRMAEELQHRVGNNLLMVSGMLENYSMSLAAGEAREGIHQIARRVTVLGQVYNSLLGVGLSETLDLGSYISALCARLPGLQADRSRPVRIICHSQVVLLALSEVTSLGMAVAELVSISYNYAFPDQDRTITVSLSHAGRESATITVQADGVGFVAKEDGTRHGVGLVRRLLEPIAGTLDMHLDKGTVWTLTFAVPVLSDQTKVAASSRSTGTQFIQCLNAIDERTSQNEWSL